MRPLPCVRSDCEPIAVACRFISRSGRETAEDATQMFGGRGITVGGMGKIIENVRCAHLLSPQHELLTLSPVSPNVTVRRYPRWCRGCTGRSWCSTGDSEDTKGCTFVNDCIRGYPVAISVYNYISMCHIQPDTALLRECMYP